MTARLAKNPKRMNPASGRAGTLRRIKGDQRGETITEVLVAMVIAGLALLMLATTIATSSNIVRNSRESMESYYSMGNQLAAYEASDDTITTSPLTMTLSNDLGFAIQPTGAGAGSAIKSISVTAYAGEDAGNTVVSYVEGSS